MWPAERRADRQCNILRFSEFCTLGPARVFRGTGFAQSGRRGARRFRSAPTVAEPLCAGPAFGALHPGQRV